MPSEASEHVPARKRHDALALLLIVILGLACAWLAFVHLDQAVVDADKGWTEHPAWQAALTVGMWLGNWQLAPLLVVLLLFAARPHWRRLLKTLAVAYILRTALVQWMKLIVGRPRPRVVADAAVFEGFGGGRSFPSGHASFAFMMAVIIAAWFPRWRWPAWIVASFVAVSRVLVDAHYVSDVIVGAVIGTIVGLVTLLIWPAVTDETRAAVEDAERRRRETKRRPGPEERATERRIALHVLVVVLLAAGAILAYWFIDPIPGFHGNAFFQHPWVVAVSKLGRLLGTWELAPLLIAVALIAAHRLWKELLVSLVGGYMIQTTATEIMKCLLGRPRPSQIPDPNLFFGPGTEYHSLPSGHASFIFMFATICSAYFPRSRYALYGLAGFVALSRVVLGAHYVSDVTVGALLGVLSGWIVLAVWRPPGDRDGDGAEDEAGEAGAERQWRSLRLRPIAEDNNARCGREVGSRGG